MQTGAVFAYEALVRGVNNEGAGHVLAQVNDANRYAFDQRCRVSAIESVAQLGLQQTPAFLSINFLPNAVYKAEACIRLTLETARATAFPGGPDHLRVHGKRGHWRSRARQEHHPRLQGAGLQNGP